MKWGDSIEFEDDQEGDLDLPEKQASRLCVCFAKTGWSGLHWDTLAQVYGPDKDGVKTIIEYKQKETGKLVKQTKKVRVSQVTRKVRFQGSE